MRPERDEPGEARESVWDYPRPPALMHDTRPIVVMFEGTTIAETAKALRILETSHPPTFYLPLDDVRRDLLRPAAGTSFCEWKGAAAYVDVVVGDRVAREAGWYYPDPSPRYAALRDHVAIYAGRVDRCTVDGIEVTPSPAASTAAGSRPMSPAPSKGSRAPRGW